MSWNKTGLLNYKAINKSTRYALGHYMREKYHHLSIDLNTYYDTFSLSEGQGSLASCSPCSCEDSDKTWKLNNNKAQFDLVGQTLSCLIRKGG